MCPAFDTFANLSQQIDPTLVSWTREEAGQLLPVQKHNLALIHSEGAENAMWNPLARAQGRDMVVFN